MTPKVSVVIPMLNARAYVADTLDGVFGQTVPPHEVIVVDNGSTDGSPAFVRERYPRARVISEPVPGPSAARNAGAAAASGDLLAFCDSDDVWLPWKLERQLDLLAEVKARDGAYPGVATCRSQLVPDATMRGAIGDWSRRPPLAVATITELGFEGLLRRDSFCPSGALMPADVFRLVGGFAPGSDGAEDLDLWVRVAAFRSVLRQEQVLFLYRMRAGSYCGDAGRVHSGLAAMLRKWAPGNSVRPVQPSFYRTACTRRMLSATLRLRKEGRAFPASLFEEFPLDPPLASLFGFGLWLAHRHPRLFSAVCRLNAFRRQVLSGRWIWRNKLLLTRSARAGRR